MAPPKLPANRKASIQVNIRLTPEEAERIRRAARRDRTTVSGFIRAIVMQKATPAGSPPAPAAG